MSIIELGLQAKGLGLHLLIRNNEGEIDWFIHLFKRVPIGINYESYESETIYKVYTNDVEQSLLDIEVILKDYK